MTAPRTTARLRIGPAFVRWLGPWRVSHKFGWWRDAETDDGRGGRVRWAQRYSDAQ